MLPNINHKKILIAPLDWGLGHASRIVPLIHHLLKLGNTVQLGGSGISGVLLQREFPTLHYTEIPAKKMEYSTFLPMELQMLKQAPAFLMAIQEEHSWVKKYVKEHAIDFIISDHRYGLYHTEVPSVIIAHQLFIDGGKMKITEPLLKKMNFSYIEKFSELWIPDIAGEKNLSGKLAHAESIAMPHQFIGPLTKCEKFDVKKNIDLLVILSGLEPLRTSLEKKIAAQLFDHEQLENVIVVRGTTEKRSVKFPNEVLLFDMLNSAEINALLNRAKVVLSRSGYSSIMDYYKLQTKTILVPTAGQTEQEYLAKYHLEQGNFYSVSESNLKLEIDLKFALQYSCNLLE